MVYIQEKMDISIVEIGKMENKMDQASIILMIQKGNLEFGKMER